MGFDPVLPPEIDRPCPELCFHDAEAFLDLPAFFIDPYDLPDIHIIYVGTDCIESVVLLFSSDHALIKIRYLAGTDFAFIRDGIPANEAVRIILILFALFVASCSDQFLCPFYLSLPDPALVQEIFQGEGYDEMLFQGFCALTDLPAGKIFFDPAVLIRCCMSCCLREDAILPDRARIPSGMRGVS